MFIGIRSIAGEIMKIKFLFLLVSVLILTSCNSDVNIDSAEMYVSPKELDEKERSLVNLFSDMNPRLFNYSISGNVRGAYIRFADYSDESNIKTETLFSFSNDSESLKRRIAISDKSDQIRIAVESDFSSTSIQKQLDSAALSGRIIYLNRTHEVIIGEPIPLAVILKSINLKPIETNQVEDFMKNHNLFEQYDNSYVVTITFYDNLQNDLQ
jgi:hypothetical protein